MENTLPTAMTCFQLENLLSSNVCKMFAFIGLMIEQKRLRPLEGWDRGFESHSMHGCLSAFILCLCCAVYVDALRRADNPSKAFYRLSKIKKLK
jgi:hypothetical protein